MTINVGDRVRTADKLTACDTYEEEHQSYRCAGAHGVVIGTGGSGRYFDVHHDNDGAIAPYDADELTVVPNVDHDEPQAGGLGMSFEETIERYCTPDVQAMLRAARAATEKAADIRAKVEALFPREARVPSLVARGRGDAFREVLDIIDGKTVPATDRLKAIEQRMADEQAKVKP